MFFEITLIQRLTLFLGYPTYSLTVTLASILVFTGVGAAPQRPLDGAARTGRAGARWPRIVALAAFYLFGPAAAHRRAARRWPLALRVLVAFVVLAPLGLCLGMFMPLGLGAVAASPTTARSTWRGAGR